MTVSLSASLGGTASERQNSPSLRPDDSTGGCDAEVAQPGAICNSNSDSDLYSPSSQRPRWPRPLPLLVNVHPSPSARARRARFLGLAACSPPCALRSPRGVPVRAAVRMAFSSFSRAAAPSRGRDRPRYYFFRGSSLARASSSPSLRARSLPSSRRFDVTKDASRLPRSRIDPSSSSAT